MLEPGRLPGLFTFGGRSAAGFTLTELIVTIVVVGILAATVLPRFGGNSFEERGFRDEVAAALRYAQKSAIASRRLVCVAFTATTVTARVASVAGAADCTVGAALISPSGSEAMSVTATGAGFAATPVGLTFNAVGRPSAGVIITFLGLPANLNVVVEAETGYVR